MERNDSIAVRLTLIAINWIFVEIGA